VPLSVAQVPTSGDPLEAPSIEIESHPAKLHGRRENTQNASIGRGMVGSWITGGDVTVRNSGTGRTFVILSAAKNLPLLPRSFAALKMTTTYVDSQYRAWSFSDLA
jgi:hypothetical protein